MTAQEWEGVRVPADDEFTRLADPYRRELLAHCYRMTGSVHDAEDLVQETYLRAWKAYGDFEARASIRTWLHRIATRVCLTALQHKDRRLLPSGLGAPSEAPDGPLGDRLPEAVWLQPLPDILWAPQPGDPAVIVEQRAKTRLALIAAMQRLPPRQRAALILSDVMDMSGADVADTLGTSRAAANSALQRARAQIAEWAPAAEEIRESPDVDAGVLDQYMAAFERADIPAVSRLLSDDVELQMPPIATWFRGREDVSRFFEVRVLRSAVRRYLPTSANGQPTAASYVVTETGELRPHGIQVLTVSGGRITHLHVFLTPELFPAFGLPLVLT